MTIQMKDSNTVVISITSANDFALKQWVGSNCEQQGLLFQSEKKAHVSTEFLNRLNIEN